MRRLNVRLLFCLIALVAILGGGIFLLHYFQRGRIAQAMLWQARRAEEEGEINKSAAYLQRYLEFAPDDATERIRLARLLASDYYAGSIKAREQALFNLDRVIRKQPELMDVRETAVRLLMELE